MQTIPALVSPVFISLAACVSCVAFAHADSPIPADAIESIRVNQVLESMQQAVSDRDAGAYMSLVDPSDPVFATEQRAWFADLQRDLVEDIQFSIAWNEPVRLQSDGSAIAPIEITWHVLTEELDRHYAYNARFAPLGSVTGQWAFVGRAWDVNLLETQGVRVYADQQHEQLAKLAESRAVEIRDVIAENLQAQTGADSGIAEIVIKVFPQMSGLQASIYLSYIHGLSGWNEPGESIKILGKKDFDQSWIDPLLAHEIGHAVSFEFGPEINNAPWWTLEGIAEVAAGLFRDSRESKNRRIATLAQKDDLRDWDLLADFKGEARNHARYVYLQGWSMIDYIDRTQGVEQRNLWFARLGQGDSIDQASKAVFGFSFDKLDQQWHQSLLEWSQSD